MKPIYVIHPGKIRRRTGQIEHFAVDDLLDLYKVEFDRCLIYNPHRKYTDTESVRYIHLRPRDDENYTLPK